MVLPVAEVRNPSDSDAEPMLSGHDAERGSEVVTEGNGRIGERPPCDLSVAIVCRSNEDTIGRTLDSVGGLASEIVAVDSGSTDGTLDLLERAGARIERTEWMGHVRTKQRALELCRCRWVLSLDSDESVEPRLASAIREALALDERGVAGYRVNRCVWMHGRYLKHAWQPEWRTRLVRRSLVPDLIAWGGEDPHDQLIVRAGAGSVRRLEGRVRHDTAPDFGAFLESQLRLSRVAARSQVAKGRRGSVWRVMTSPGGAFLKQMVLKQAWRDGWRGWCAAGSTAAATLMKHLMILDEARRARSDTNQPGCPPGMGG